MKRLLVSLALAGCCCAAQTGKASMVLGYQFDISRDRVPMMETLYRMVDILSALPSPVAAAEPSGRPR